MKAFLHRLILCTVSFTVLICCQLKVSAQPVITTVSPQEGKLGSLITISGSNFSATSSNNIVYFGATRAMVTNASPTELTVKVPQGASYDFITVNTSGLTAYSPQPFDVLVPTTGTGSSFMAAANYPASSYALMTAIGDLNADGKPDVAVTNYQAENSVSVYVNKTVATGGVIYLADRQNFSTGAFPTGISIGDIDGDGKPDIIVVSQGDSKVSVLRNTSSGGTLSFASHIDFGVGSQAFSVAINDLDGDGKPDLIVNNQTDNTISILKNESSSGNILFASQFVLGTGNNPYDVAVADLDADGKPDIIVPNGNDNTVSVFRNATTAAGFSFTTTTLPAGSFPVTARAADIDGDGKLDIVIANGGDNSFSVFRNTSSGKQDISFAPISSFPVGFPGNVVLADINGDGKPDIANADNNSPGGVVVRINTSTSSGNISFTANSEYNTDDYPSWVSAVDLNADGLPDFITANAESSISVLQNDLQILTLPVTIINFTGVYNNSNAVDLQWQTASEINADYFEVQRSTDAINFTLVGKITAGGTTSSLSNYNYKDNIDTVNSGNIYYRLKEYDVDGSYEYYSRILKINLPIKNQQFNLSPNPASTYIHITGRKRIKHIKIIDISGKEIIAQSPAALRDISVDVSKLTEGLYFVQITDIDGITETSKLIKK